MESLSADGSTLPALKDLFPEHFHENPEIPMDLPQPGNVLPQQSDVMPQLSHYQQQQDVGAEQQGMQYAMPNGITNNACVQQFIPVRKRGRGRKLEANFYVHSMPPPGDVHLNLLAAGGQTQDGTGDTEGGDDADGTDDSEKRRHLCFQCGKRFNRPSSLKIHMNTHTGARPFLCPFRGCGRSFNVSSNMRRHFRNHARRPPSPPLPQSNAYPMPPIEPTEPRRGRPSARRTPQHQQLSLPPTYDGGAGFSNLPSDYSAQFYPPSSDVRNSENVSNALITPPYTNGGSEHFQEDQSQREFYPMEPHSAFGQYPSSNPMFNGAQMGMHQEMAGMQMPVNLPPDPAIRAPAMFPVDPALVNGRGGDNPDAEGEVDADGEVDPDSEVANVQMESTAVNARRFGPSTSNARESLDSRLDSRQRMRKPAGANNLGNASFSAPLSNVNGWLPPSANMPCPPQAAHYPQQYQAQYPQQAQAYQYQQQQQMFAPNGMNGAYDQYSPSVGAEQGGYASNVPPEAYHAQQQYGNASLQNGDRFGRNAVSQDVNASALAQASSKTTRKSRKQDGSAIAVDGVKEASGVSSNTTPGAAPAPPYELLSHPPPEVAGGEQGGKTAGTATKASTSRAKVSSYEEGAEADEEGEEDEEESDDDVDEDDDDEYVEKTTPKKRQATKRASSTKGTGRPRGRPKGSGKGTGRGRGRPRKSMASTVGAQTELEERQGSEKGGGKDTEESDGIEVGGRILRKRARVVTR